MERRAWELDAGARELGREHVLRLGMILPVLVEPTEVFLSETDYGYSSIRVPTYQGEITTFIDRASDGLYRLKQVSHGGTRVQTTNYVDWPELKSLYDFFAACCVK